MESLALLERKIFIVYLFSTTQKEFRLLRSLSDPASRSKWVKIRDELHEEVANVKAISQELAGFKVRVLDGV
jgi:hypothetical protein